MSDKREDLFDRLQALGVLVLDEGGYNIDLEFEDGSLFRLEATQEGDLVVSELEEE